MGIGFQLHFKKHNAIIASWAPSKALIKISLILEQWIRCCCVMKARMYSTLGREGNGNGLDIKYEITSIWKRFASTNSKLCTSKHTHFRKKKKDVNQKEASPLSRAPPSLGPAHFTALSEPERRLSGPRTSSNLGPDTMAGPASGHNANV